MAKSQPMIPTTNTHAPQKTTLLDGGFFGQRKHRNHGVISEKQIKREGKRDLCCHCFDETFCVEVEIGDDISVNSAHEQNLTGAPTAHTNYEQSYCESYCGAFTSAVLATFKIFRLDREFQRIAALMLPVSFISFSSYPAMHGLSTYQSIAHCFSSQ
jgi:hypothetical protein